MTVYSTSFLHLLTHILPDVCLEFSHRSRTAFGQGDHARFPRVLQPRHAGPVILPCGAQVRCLHAAVCECGDPSLCGCYEGDLGVEPTT